MMNKMANKAVSHGPEDMDENTPIAIKPIPMA
jgi:hypothetical protein